MQENFESTMGPILQIQKPRARTVARQENAYCRALLAGLAHCPLPSLAHPGQTQQSMSPTRYPRYKSSGRVA
eukprot:364173-Chlamydomonas_euryale.AAC.14